MLYIPSSWHFRHTKILSQICGIEESFQTVEFKYLYFLKKQERERLNEGTVPPDITHPGGTAPPDKTHPGGTVPPDKRHPGGTVPPDKTHPGGTIRVG